MAFGEVGGIRGDLVGDDAVFHVFLFGELGHVRMGLLRRKSLHDDRRHLF